MLCTIAILKKYPAIICSLIWLKEKQDLNIYQIRPFTRNGNEKKPLSVHGVAAYQFSTVYRQYIFLYHAAIKI